MDNPFYHEGSIQSVSVESAPVIKTGLSWKEGTREFLGREIYDRKGLLIEKQSQKETALYTYSPEDLLQTVKFFDKNKQLRKTVLYGYDRKNRLVRETILNQGKEEPDEIFYEHDEKNHITAKKEGHSLKVFRYSGEGLLLSEYSYTDREPELIVLYRYDDNRLISREYRDPDEKLQRTELFSYTENGELSSCRRIGRDKIIINHDLYEYSSYHEKNWLRRIKYSVSEDIRKIREIPVEVLYRSINYFESVKKQDKEPVQARLEFPNGIYKGETLNGLMHGKGIFEYKDGGFYEGEFRNGIMEGFGTLIKPDGRVYTGEFRDGLMDGQGNCRWPGGDEYKGEFHKGMMHGVGIFTWGNGSRFRGLFEKNKRTDQGLIETGDNN